MFPWYSFHASLSPTSSSFTDYTTPYLAWTLKAVFPSSQQPTAYWQSPFESLFHSDLNRNLMRPNLNISSLHTPSPPCVQPWSLLAGFPIRPHGTSICPIEKYNYRTPAILLPTSLNSISTLPSVPWLKSSYLSFWLFEWLSIYIVF